MSYCLSALVQWGLPTVSVEGVFGMLAGVFASAIESVGGKKFPRAGYFIKKNPQITTPAPDCPEPPRHQIMPFTGGLEQRDSAASLPACSGLGMEPPATARTSGLSGSPRSAVGGLFSTPLSSSSVSESSVRLGLYL